MPIYEYKCQSCHNTLEFLQKYTEPLQNAPCPDCHGKLERIVSAPHFELKGTGWYATDFKNSDKKPPENTKPSEETKTAASTNDKSTDKTVPSTPSTSKDDTP